MGEEKEQSEEKKTIILPEEVQIEMMKFFLRTSIPRKKHEEQAHLSKQKDGSDT